MKNEFLETIKVVDGIHLHMLEHQNRYENTLKSFNIKDFKDLNLYLNPPKTGTYKCRLVYNLEKIIEVKYSKYKKRDIKTLKIIHDNNIEYKYKSTSRQSINQLFLQKEDCDDVLIVKNGLITDTSIANIAFYDGAWNTPKTPLLYGTTRSRLLKSGFLVEKDIGYNDINKYSKVALLNAMIDFDIIQTQNIKDIFC